MNKTQLEANIWKLALNAATNKRTYMTFLTIFLLTMPDATAKTIGLLTLVSQITGVLFEVPSGYISDRIGHQKSLIISRSALLLSTCMYIFADAVWWFFAGSLLWGIGLSFLSGSTGAFLHETLLALDRDHEYAKVMGRIRSFGFVPPVVFILFLAFVAESSFRLAFVFAAVIDVIGLIAVTIMHTPKDVHVSTKEVQPSNFKATLQELIRAGWVPFVVFGSLMFGITLGATAGFKNPYQELLGFSVTMIGALWALSRIIIALLLLASGWIHERFSIKHYFILRTSSYVILFLLIGVFQSPWVTAVAFIFLTTFMWGLEATKSQYFLDSVKTSPNKATLISLRSLADKLTTAIFGLIMGYFVFFYDYASSYLIVAAILFVVVVLMVWLLPKGLQIEEKGQVV